MRKIVFATNNANKLKEVRDQVGNTCEILSLKEINCFEELPETHETLEENSLEKASYVYDKFRLPCFSEDTGLEVDALNGAPGVYSARYAGEAKSADDNMRKLLEEMGKKTDRKARFRTVFTFIDEVGIHQFEGSVNGQITRELSGAKGFGYDPVFQPENKAITFAEMTSNEKNQISHRSRGLKKLLDFLENHPNGG